MEKICPKCGRKLEKKYEVEGCLNGNDTTLEGIIYFECPNCDDVYKFSEEMKSKLSEWIEAGFELKDIKKEVIFDGDNE